VATSALLAGALALVASVGAAVLIHRFAVFTTVVRSDSMRPLLEPGDVLLASRAHRPRRLRRGEILVFRVPDAPGIRIRRLIGLPGDRVEFLDGGVVVVNGEPIFEPYARRSGVHRRSFAVPADRCFVLDDHRRDVLHARTWQESFVPRGEILGVARVRLLPWPIAATGVLAR
jgi:signal peptidase I